MRDRIAIANDVDLVVVPGWIVYHELLSPLAVRLYIALRHLGDGDGWKLPDAERLGERLGTTAAALEAAMLELQHVGAVIVENKRVVVAVLPPRTSAVSVWREGAA